jgi:hypothetical protein
MAREGEGPADCNARRSGGVSYGMKCISLSPPNLGIPRRFINQPRVMATLQERRLVSLYRPLRYPGDTWTARWTLDKMQKFHQKQQMCRTQTRKHTQTRARARTHTHTHTHTHQGLPAFLLDLLHASLLGPDAAGPAALPPPAGGDVEGVLPAALVVFYKAVMHSDARPRMQVGGFSVFSQTAGPRNRVAAACRPPATGPKQRLARLWAGLRRLRPRGRAR